MAKTPAQLGSLARSHCLTAIEVCRGIMNNEETPPNIRLMAATILFDRGLGKPVQQLSVDGKLDGMLTIVTGVPERLNGGELTMEAIEQGTEPTDSAAGHSTPEQHRVAMEPAAHTHTASHSLTPSPVHTSSHPTPGTP